MSVFPVDCKSLSPLHFLFSKPTSTQPCIWFSCQVTQVHLSKKDTSGGWAVLSAELHVGRGLVQGQAAEEGGRRGGLQGRRHYDRV